MRINSPTPNRNVFERNQLYISKCNVRHVTIQVCSGFEQNRRHFKRSPCNPDIHNPDKTSHHKGNLNTVANGAETIDRYPIVFINIRSSPPVFNTIHIVVSQIRNGLYDPKVLSRLTRIVSAYSKISVAFKFIQFTTNTYLKVIIDSRLFNYK